eukprot:TRINITY_DN5615_c0_g1_i1.p1 TRINITY_DN5615_c0_g1~~TRINITY_DN5615_c0_g1_i1.p1  ORF type:complete len:1103 (+),score=431.33 TRINITY_DN5615_c0_g1_i1:71-3310(+)
MAAPAAPPPQRPVPPPIEVPEGSGVVSTEGAGGAEPLDAAQFRSPKSPEGGPREDEEGGRKGRKQRKVISDEALCDELFNIIDADLGGSVSREEMAQFVRIVDPKAPRQLVDAIMAAVEAEGDADGEIGAGAFRELIMSGHLGERPGVLLERYKGQQVRIQSRGGPERYLASVPQAADVAPEVAERMLHDRQVAYLRRTAQPRELFQELWGLIDADGDGQLSRAEVTALVRCVKPGATRAQVEAFVRSADKDASGSIDFDEFIVALEEGTLGVPPEELLPSVRKSVRQMREGTFKDAPGPETERTMTPEEVERAMEEVKALQERAEEQRKKSQASAEEEKRRRLRGRLIDFYARHNPDKVREEEISRVVEAAVTKHIDEDDLFRQLYKKYNLDESGEPKQESEESDWTNEESLSTIDSERIRAAPNEEERKKLTLERRKRKLKKLYHEQKREEALHKAVLNQIKKESREEKQRARDAMQRFVAEYKSEEERRADRRREQEREQQLQQEETMRQSENRFAREQNRRLWRSALEDAREERFNELTQKISAKRAWNASRRKLVETRVRLREAVIALEAENLAHIRLAQAQRIVAAFAARQEGLLGREGHQQELAELEQRLAALQQSVDEAAKARSSTVEQRDQTHQMYIANKYNAMALQQITDKMQGELRQMQANRDRFEHDCSERLRLLSEQSQADICELQSKLDCALADLEAELKAKEEMRMKEDHTRISKESGLLEQMGAYKARCDKEVLELKDKLLGIYPTLMMDLASHIGKLSEHAVGQQQREQRRSRRSRSPSAPPPADSLASVLSLYRPRLPASPATPADAPPPPQHALLQYDEGVCRVTGPPAEGLPAEAFDALRCGDLARLWRWKLYGRTEAECGSEWSIPSELSAASDAAAALCPLSEEQQGETAWRITTLRGTVVEVTLRVEPAGSGAAAAPRGASPAVPRRTAAEALGGSTPRRTGRAAAAGAATPPSGAELLRRLTQSDPDSPAGPPPPPGTPTHRQPARGWLTPPPLSAVRDRAASPSLRRCGSPQGRVREAASPRCSPSPRRPPAHCAQPQRAQPSPLALLTPSRLM